MRTGIIAIVLLAACGGHHLIPIIPEGATAGTTAAPTDLTFEVIARIAGASDPLGVDGSDVAYADLERALGQAVLFAAVPRHNNVLTVELIAAQANYSAEGRLSVSLVARATLRSHVGNTFIAQTTVVCRDGAIVAPEQGAKVIWSCMSRIGHDLGGWLADLPHNPEGT